MTAWFGSRTWPQFRVARGPRGRGPGRRRGISRDRGSTRRATPTPWRSPRRPGPRQGDPVASRPEAGRGRRPVALHRAAIDDVMTSAVAGRPAGGPGALRIPARLAHDADHRARDPGLGARDVHRHVPLRRCRSTSCRSAAWRSASAIWWTTRSSCSRASSEARGGPRRRRAPRAAAPANVAMAVTASTLTTVAVFVPAGLRRGTGRTADPRPGADHHLLAAGLAGCRPDAGADHLRRPGSWIRRASGAGDRSRSESPGSLRDGESMGGSSSCWHCRRFVTWLVASGGTSAFGRGSIVCCSRSTPG